MGGKLAHVNMGSPARTSHRRLRGYSRAAQCCLQVCHAALPPTPSAHQSPLPCSSLSLWLLMRLLLPVQPEPQQVPTPSPPVAPSSSSKKSSKKSAKKARKQAKQQPHPPAADAGTQPLPTSEPQALYRSHVQTIAHDWAEMALSLALCQEAMRLALLERWQLLDWLQVRGCCLVTSCLPSSQKIRPHSTTFKNLAPVDRDCCSESLRQQQESWWGCTPSHALPLG
jgi:hypothetical protein